MKRRTGFVAVGLLIVAGAAAAWLRSADSKPAGTPRSPDRAGLPASVAPAEGKPAGERPPEEGGRDAIAPAPGKPMDPAMQRGFEERRAASLKRAEEARAQAIERARKERERLKTDPNRPPPPRVDLGPAVVEEQP